ncbi:DUF302 domain-containing protein [Mesorhizobium sp.]|uniref:DUF302 domain-containing protein n=1 Tax=Mesorhizobium sp. TaxID=1871066 RepID=UPI000FE58911|nr:DUF302 domain-containing protein [Mesorhizobium sp.]RWA73551.1 MAG: DUF302 domain-containing protein [Mesorhizobium sp.]RWA84656.1 MAG: DUF302 domain-containing protein [Mesorhizobium sp.]
MSGRATVHHCPPGAGHAFQRAITIPLDFDATLETIRAILAELDLWIIHEIDPQMLVARAGYSIARTRQILYFHPRYMIRLLGADPSALPEVPLKIVVLEAKDRVRVSWPIPEALFERYGNADLMGLAREFASIYAAIAVKLQSPR